MRLRANVTYNDAFTAGTSLAGLMTESLPAAQVTPEPVTPPPTPWPATPTPTPEPTATPMPTATPEPTATPGANPDGAVYGSARGGASAPASRR